MRNPNNTNQELYYRNNYEGYPVQTTHGPLIKSYLDRLYSLMMVETNRHRRLFVVRLDLRFSARFELPDMAVTNQPLQRFVEFLKYQLNAKDARTLRAKGRLNPHGMSYAWAREVGPESYGPHYHLLLMFNGDSYRTVGNYSNPEAPGLYQRLQEAWSYAIQLDFDLAHGLVSVVPNGQWMLNKTDGAAFAEIFHAASYLCKAGSKVFQLGFHCFGTSRCQQRPA